MSVLRDDVIIRAAIVKGEINLHKQLLLVRNKTRSVDTVRWALDRPLWHFMTLKCLAYKEAVDLELTWQHPLSEFRPKQTRAVCVNRFHLSLWACMGACMITSFTHVGIISTTRPTNY